MSNPYRSYLAPLETPTKASRNIFRYIVVDTIECFQCHWTSRVDKRFCSVMQPLLICGFWFWKKYCPIEIAHTHMSCRQCAAQWIKYMDKKLVSNEERSFHG